MNSSFYRFLALAVISGVAFMSSSCASGPEMKTINAVLLCIVIFTVASCQNATEEDEQKLISQCFQLSFESQAITDKLNEVAAKMNELLAEAELLPADAFKPKSEELTRLSS